MTFKFIEKKKDESEGVIDSTLPSFSILIVSTYVRAWLTYRLRRANFSIAANRSYNVNKTMRDDAMPMRGAYDAPRASMSPIAEGDRGRKVGSSRDRQQPRYNIRNSWFIDLADDTLHTLRHFYIAGHVFALNFIDQLRQTRSEFV